MASDNGGRRSGEEARAAPRQDRRAGDGRDIDLRDDDPSGFNESGRGRDATKPTQVPGKGWRDVLLRTKSEVKSDMVPLLSAGVAFYGFLALVPALVAIVSIYGLVASPAELTRQIRSATSAFPKDARDLMVTQMQSISRSSKGGLGVGVVVGILGALWSASSGMKHLIEAINVAYDESETRKFVKLRGLAVLLTVAAAVFVVVAFALVALAPSLFDAIGLSGAGRVVAAILRFAVLAGGFLVGLAVLYRYAPDRDNPKWSWSSPGAIVATVLWLIGSLLFSLYTSRFGKYNETYGSLGAIVVLLLWLMLTALCVLVGAEMNSELEAQTKVDTTEGSGEPMGERGADAADRLGPVPAGRGGR